MHIFTSVIDILIPWPILKSRNYFSRWVGVCVCCCVCVLNVCVLYVCVLHISKLHMTVKESKLRIVFQYSLQNPYNLSKLHMLQNIICQNQIPLVEQLSVLLEYINQFSLKATGFCCSCNLAYKMPTQ